MCDYSLHSIKNRLAVEGEPMFVHKFYTGSKGLASVTDLNMLQKQSLVAIGTGVWAKFQAWIDRNIGYTKDRIDRSLPAVCVPPGARLEVQGIPSELQKEYGLQECEQATFVQLSADPYRYRDALRFDNGKEVLLQRLNEGLRMELLCFSLPEDRELEREEVRSHEFVAV